METIDIIGAIITVLSVGGACIWVWKQETELDELLDSIDEQIYNTKDKYYSSGKYELGSWMEN